jgi:AraC-like DNA-binding protein
MQWIFSMNELFSPFQPTITTPGLSNFGLSLQSSAPCFALKGVVHSYLQINAEKPTPYPVIPDGTQSIFISPHGSFIGGAQLQTRDIHLPEAGEYFGIRFYSGALRHFFKVDLSEITDQFVGNEYLPCRVFSELYHLIYQEKYYHNRANICEHWLLQHFNPLLKDRFDQALRQIYQSSGNIKINDLANSLALSSRHLNRLFQLYIGLSTKTFTKIIRMQHACRQVYISPHQSLNSALDLGFFDQSHFIKDFRKHLLTKPTDFSDRFMSDFYN